MKILLPTKERPEVALMPEGIQLSGKLTQPAFLASAIAAASRPLVANGAHARYQLVGEHELSGMPVWVALQFEFRRLAALLLARTTPGSKSWVSWSRALEVEKHRQHREFLEQEYGSGSHSQPWGRISAQYAPKGGCSSIILRFSHPSKSVQPRLSAG